MTTLVVASDDDGWIALDDDGAVERHFSLADYRGDDDPTGWAGATRAAVQYLTAWRER